MQAWEVGVSLVLTSNVESAAIAIGKHLLHLEGMTEKVKKQFQNLNQVIMGTLSVKIGEGMVRGLGEVLLKAKEVNAEITQLQKMNLDPASIRRFQGMSVQATRDVRGVTEAQALRLANQLGSWVGPENTTQEVINQSLRYGQVYGHTIKSYDKGMEAIQPMLQSLQQLGRLKDPATAVRSIDLLSKLGTITEGRISGEDILNAVKQGAPAMSGLSDRALVGSLIMSQPLGGHRAGTAMMSIWNQLVGGQTTQGVVKEMAKYGFIDSNYANINRQGRMRGRDGFTDFSLGGRVSGVDRHGMHSRARQGLAGGLNMRIPLEAYDPSFRKSFEAGPEEMFKHIKNKLESQGVTGEAQIQALARIFGRQTSQRLGHEWIRNLEQISGEIDRTLNALGLQSAKKLQDAKDMSQGLHNVGAAWENFVVQLGKSNSDIVVSGLNAVTDALRKLTEVMRSMNPTVIQVLTASFVALAGVFAAGGAITIMRAIGVGGWFIAGLNLLSVPLIAGSALFMALGPAGWMALGIIGLGTAFVIFKDRIDGLMDVVRKFLGLDVLRRALGIDKEWQDPSGWQDPGKHGNPAGPGANPYSFGNYQGGDWRGMITQAALHSIESEGGPAREQTLTSVDRNIHELLTIFRQALNLSHATHGGPYLNANLAGAGVGGAGGWSDIGQGRTVPSAPNSQTDRVIREMGTGRVAGGHAAPILDAISRMEGTRGYSDSFGHQLHGDLTGKTIGQIMQIQRHMHGSSAVGRYQFMRNTLSSLIRRGVVGANDRFDGPTQDKMATALLNDAGFGRWQKGQISDNQFLHGMAGIWAGVPGPSGHGRYEGVGHNRAISGGMAKAQQMFAIMRQLRDGSHANDNAGGGNLAGIRMKKGANDGHVHAAVADLAHEIQRSVPGFNHFSAFNDHFHLGRPGSLHSQGLAADFSIAGDHRKAFAAVKALMEARGLGPNDYQLIDEYDNPSHGSTGGHIHAGFRSRAAADKFRRSMVPPRMETGRPIEMHVHSHLDGRKVASSVTRHQAEFANGPSHGGQGFDRTRTFAGNDSGFRTAV
jgi:muramidase (phage lysozyme)